MDHTCPIRSPVALTMGPCPTEDLRTISPSLMAFLAPGSQDTTFLDCFLPSSFSLLHSFLLFSLQGAELHQTSPLSTLSPNGTIFSK
jgi:hypothetical protein